MRKFFSIIIFSFVFSGVSFANQEQYERCINTAKHNILMYAGMTNAGMSSRGQEGMKQAEENAKTECAYKWLSSSSSYSPQVIVISPFEDQDFYSTSDRTHWLYHSQRAIEFKDEGKYDRVIEELQESLKYLKHNGQLYQDTKLLLQHAEIKQGFIELDIWFKKYTEERDQGIYYAEKGYYESALPYFIQAKHHAKEYEQVCKKLSGLLKKDNNYTEFSSLCEVVNSGEIWIVAEASKNYNLAYDIKTQEEETKRMQKEEEIKQKGENQKRIVQIKEQLGTKAEILTNLIVEIMHRDKETINTVRTIAKTFVESNNSETKLIGKLLLLELE